MSRYGSLDDSFRAERYLSIFYDYLHEKLYEYHVLQADETPVSCFKGRPNNRNKALHVGLPNRNDVS